MPSSVRQFLGAAAAAVVSFMGYKIIYPLLSSVSNDILRTIVSSIPAILLGIGAMYLILRGQRD